MFLLLLALGTGLRFHALERQSLWDDEMSTRKDVYLPLSIWPAMFHAYEMHPPLYFYQLKGWQALTGSSLQALRANSALWGSLTLLLIFLLMRLYQGTWPALAAMALLAFSPYHLAYSQEMRPYAMATALAVLGFYWLEICFLMAKPKKGVIPTEAGIQSWTPASAGVTPKWQWVLLALVLTAELYTHYWGAFVVAAQLTYGWLRVSRSGERKPLLIAGGAAILLFGLWLPTLSSQLHYVADLSFWVPPNTPANLFKTLISFTGVHFRYASAIFEMPGARWLQVAVALAYGFLVVRALRSGPRAAWCWLAIGLGLPYLLGYWRHSVFVWYRYPSLIYPAFVLLAVSGLAALRSSAARGFLFGVLLAAGAAGCYRYFTGWQKANPKTVVAYVQRLKGTRAAVIRPKYFAELFAYYDQGPTFVVDQDLLSDPKKRSRLKGENIIFLAFDVPRDPVRDRLLAEFKTLSARSFPGYGHLGITVYQLR